MTTYFLPTLDTTTPSNVRNGDWSLGTTKILAVAPPLATEPTLLLQYGDEDQVKWEKAIPEEVLPALTLNMDQFPKVC